MPSETKPQSHRPHFKKIATVVIFVFALIIFFRENILVTAGETLNRDNSADIEDGALAILLMGDTTGERARAAIGFLEAHPQSKVVVAPEEPSIFVAQGLTPPQHEVHRMLLIAAGISEERVIVPECLDTSTLDEAVCLRRYIESNDLAPGTIAVVTSWYHTSRAAWLFQRVFAGSNIIIKAVPAVSSISNPQQWWTREASFILVFTEYLKWSYWLVNAGKIRYQGEP